MWHKPTLVSLYRSFSQIDDFQLLIEGEGVAMPGKTCEYSEPSVQHGPYDICYPPVDTTSQLVETFDDPIMNAALVICEVQQPKFRKRSWELMSYARSMRAMQDARQESYDMQCKLTESLQMNTIDSLLSTGVFKKNPARF